MSLVPSTQQGKVSFFKNKIDVWTSNAAAIGTTTVQVGALGALVDDAQKALDERDMAQAAASAAASVADQAVAAVAKAGADIISEIRTKARTGGDAVYNLAQIPVPGSSGSKTPPGQPYRFKAILDSTGALELKWKCENPSGTSGTVYQVWRQIDGVGEYECLGGNGKRAFVDETIPVGATVVSYQVQAVRSSVKGPWSEFTVKFSTNAGVTTATIGQSSAKLAA